MQNKIWFHMNKILTQLRFLSNRFPKQIHSISPLLWQFTKNGVLGVFFVIDSYFNKPASPISNPWDLVFFSSYNVRRFNAASEHHFLRVAGEMLNSIPPTSHAKMRKPKQSTSTASEEQLNSANSNSIFCLYLHHSHPHPGYIIWTIPTKILCANLDCT